MSGSGASILGYGNTEPNSNVSGEFVNKTGSTYAGNFSSDVIPTSSRSLPEPSSNIEAASGTWTGNGGKRKNIGKLYKMKAGMSRKTYTRRSKSRSARKAKRTTKHKMKRTKRMGGRRRKSRRHAKSMKRRTRRRRMRGGMGYTQYQSNVPFTPGYAVADVDVDPKMSAIANPPPYTSYNHCQDNYNHYKAMEG